MDQVYGFRVAIHLLEPPLTEMPGRSQVNERPVPAAAPKRGQGDQALRRPQGKAPRHGRSSNEWRARARGIGCLHRVGSVSGALQERQAINAGRPRTSAPRMVFSGPQAQGLRHARFEDRVFKGRYLPWTEESANRLQETVKSVGGLPAQPPSVETSPPGTCTIFVDGLRYDAAQRLLAQLAPMGTARIDAEWTSLPSVTASGKAWCSPVAGAISGTKADVEFEPRVAGEGKPLSTHNFRKLLLEHGIQVFDSHELGDPAGCAWTEAGDLDYYGHAHGIRLARDMDVQLQQVSERVMELQQAGWKKLRIVTDHGWLLMPGGLPKAELPKHDTQTRWGRCAVLKDTAHGTTLTFGWSWCAEVQVAYAPGAPSFVAGSEYAHGGLSLQECLVPVVTLDTVVPGQTVATATIVSITWKGLRCTVAVDSPSSGLTVGIRKKAAVATNPVAAAKPLQNGKASLAVADDELLGTVVFVVVLDADGEVVQKATTTVGE